LEEHHNRVTVSYKRGGNSPLITFINGFKKIGITVDYLSALVAGLGAGSLYAVIGVLLVIMFTLTKVVNFSQVAVGVYAAFLSIRFGHLLTDLGVTKPLLTVLSVIFAIIVGALLSALIGWIISMFLPTASTSTRSAVTVAGMLFLISLSLLQFGPLAQPLIPLVIGPFFSFDIVTVTKISVFMLGLAILILIIAKIVLNKTNVGIQLRAIADRPTAVELLGVNVKALQVGVWAASGAFMTLAIMIGGNNLASQATVSADLIIPGAAAALIGAFKKLNFALVGGLALGAVQGVIVMWPEISVFRDWIAILIIIFFLLWNQRKEVWDVAR
jgi:branched-chain amino acid transport system permease protein